MTAVAAEGMGLHLPAPMTGRARSTRTLLIEIQGETKQALLGGFFTEQTGVGVPAPLRLPKRGGSDPLTAKNKKVGAKMISPDDLRQR